MHFHFPATTSKVVLRLNSSSEHEDANKTRSTPIRTNFKLAGSCRLSVCGRRCLSLDGGTRCDCPDCFASHLFRPFCAMRNLGKMTCPLVWFLKDDVG
ncbi:unnamed protein product [Amoebophrya sp. A120]|nr:unnamed protein product [Amoebophrya sp. A120]|eukprot:GSA120T00015025001.1